MPEELNVHRKQILRKCQGLPLAANVIGGLLLRLQKMEDWLSIVENKILKLGGEHTDGIMQVLKLSFDYLPSSSIKKCFAYCSIFPKDETLEGDELIELWMAEGFLEGNDVERGTMMEEIGGKYLRILLQSSLLVIDTYFGEPYYQMHDLVHDLATNVSKRKRPNGESGLSNDGQSPYLALDSFGEGTEKVLNAMSPLIRTLFLKNTNISFEMILKFKNLHVLNLSGEEIVVKELPNSISILKHLRYLNLSSSTIRRLPESLCKLYHLQTLRLDFCSDLQGLPQGMNNLISLRHLHCDTDNNEKFQMPVEMGRLTCLQTLGFFNIGGEKGRGIEELGPMEKLKGPLEIRNLELVKGKEEAQQADLFGKQNLTGLTFGWTSRDRHGIDIDCDEQVLEGLQPQTNLKWLRIENYMGDRFPQWLGNLTCLGSLNLENCKSCKELPALGHLPCLEQLWLEGLENVGCIGTSFYNSIEEDGGRVVVSRRRKLFPALKWLTLIGMSNLVEWKEVEGVDDGGEHAVFPKLEDLRIRDCSRLTTTPTQFPSLKEVVIGNVQVMTVKAILSKTFGALKCLWIQSMDDMTCLSQVVEVQHNNNRPKSLEVLEITQCNRLTNIPSETLHYCKILKEVYVKNCPNLESFPLDLQQTPSISSISLLDCPKLFTTNDMPRGFGHLTNLRSLSIGPYSDDFIQLFDWPGLLCCSSTLQELQLYGYDQMQTQLPDQFHHFTSLRRLTLKGYEALEVLPDWLGNLGSLEEISLEDCQKLQHLPSIAAMGHLTKLRTLRLRNCPLLKEKCNSKSNPDSEWSKISRLLNNQIQVRYW